MKCSWLLLSSVLFLFACARSQGALHQKRPTPHLTERVHFSFGSDALSQEAEDSLLQNVQWFHAHPDAVAVLEGHADEHGSSGYNLELGDRRARRVAAFLIDHGVDPDRMILIVSHGERRPLSTEHTQDAWRMNRRVEFVVR